MEDFEIIIRKETPSDYYETECIVREAFWNKYMPGADQHYYVNKLRSHKDYVSELSRIATTKDNKIIGALFYSKAWIVNENKEMMEILNFRPLCVYPDYQKKGVGKKLLKTTLDLAKEKGYKFIVIWGNATYYPPLGFKTTNHYNITTSDGQYNDHLFGYEIQSEALQGFKGVFKQSIIYEEVQSQKVIDDFVLYMKKYKAKR